MIRLAVVVCCIFNCLNRPAQKNNGCFICCIFCRCMRIYKPLKIDQNIQVLVSVLAISAARYFGVTCVGLLCRTAQNASTSRQYAN